MNADLDHRERADLARRIIALSGTMPSPEKHANYLLTLKPSALRDRLATLQGQQSKPWQPNRKFTNENANFSHAGV